jgi:hypothetical protein
MRLRLPIMSAAASVAVLGLGFGMTTAASATTTGSSGSAYFPLTSAHQGAGGSPDISNFITYQQTNLRGTPHPGACVAGRLYVANHNPVKSVRNNCEFRIYLQQNPGGATGWQVCIDPHSVRTSIDSDHQNPAAIKVGLKKSNC